MVCDSDDDDTIVNGRRGAFWASLLSVRVSLDILLSPRAGGE